MAIMLLVLLCLVCNMVFVMMKPFLPIEFKWEPMILLIKIVMLRLEPIMAEGMMKKAAGMMCYAGTTPEKGQETLDVIIGEFERLSEGISEEEIQRAKVGLKAALILQSESSSSRAGGIASDYYMYGRVRSLDEIKGKVEETSVDSVVGFLRNNKFKDYTVVTIGPKKVRA